MYERTVDLQSLNHVHSKKRRSPIIAQLLEINTYNPSPQPELQLTVGKCARRGRLSDGSTDGTEVGESVGTHVGDKVGTKADAIGGDKDGWDDVDTQHVSSLS